MPARQIPDTAAEGEPSDPGRGNDTSRRGEAKRVCGGIEVAPGCAALGPCRFRIRVDPDATHSGEVNDNAVVVCSEPRAAMAAAPDRQIKAVVPCVPDGGHHISGVGHSNHHRRTFVDHAVVDQTGVLVVGVAWSNHLAPYVVAQFTRSFGVHGLSPCFTLQTIPSR